VKAIILAAIVSAISVPAIHGQGYFNFNNLYGGGTITVASTGDYAGSEYNVSLYYEVGNVFGNPDPTTLTLLASQSVVALLGSTGGPPNHGPAADGAGTFDGGAAVFPSTGDGTVISVEVAAWYAGPGATSYTSAAAHGYDVGHSALVPITLVAGTDNNVKDLSAMAPFVVGVPEPSTMAIGALGAAALLLVRRKLLK
jgi:hypothetical protein